MTCLDLLAVNLDALETLSIQATDQPTQDSRPKKVCNSELQFEIGNDLPADFDACFGDKQFVLMSKGLYRTQSGDIEPLPPAAKKSHTVRKVSVPMPDLEPVHNENSSPIVLDIESLARSDQSAHVAGQIKTHNRPPETHKNQSHGTLKSTKIFPKQPRLGCPQFATFSHRGSATQPENSQEAVIAALRQGHTGVEVDVQQLRDGSWVVHHDLTVGRTTYGQTGSVSGMAPHQWRQVHLKSRQGQETRIPAPFLVDVLNAFKDNARPSQVLNIEIKKGLQAYSCEDLTLLDQTVRRTLGPSQFLYSSRSLEDLACLRSADPSGYLGLVIDPHPKSVEEMPQNKPKTKTSSLLERFSKKVDLASEYQQQSNRALLAKSNFTDVFDLIGPNYGLHIDYRDFVSLSSKTTIELGRVLVYQLDDDEGLQSMLTTLLNSEKALPDGALVDTSRREYCAGENIASQ